MTLNKNQLHVGKRRNIIKFDSDVFEEAEWYAGVVTKVVETKEALRLYVELDSVPGEEFVKYMRFSKRRCSQMGEFFADMGVMDERGRVDLDELKGMAVEVTLYKGKNNLWYIERARLQEDEEEVDEDDMPEFEEDGYDEDEDEDEEE